MSCTGRGGEGVAPQLATRATDHSRPRAGQTRPDEARRGQTRSDEAGNGLFN